MGAETRSLGRKISPSHPSAFEVHSRRAFWAATPGLLVLGVQLITLSPTVTGEDSGEFLTAAWHFGVPHPPGYPLWTMLCGAFMHLFPIGNIAWRGNLFSALCTAATVVILAASLRRIGFRYWPAGAAAAVCGLGDAVWSQSVITEVYTLNLVVTALLLYLFVRWHRDRAQHWLCAASLLFGLGMANHHIIGFAALGLGLWALILAPRLMLEWRLMLRCGFAFAVGLLPYAYMLGAAQRDVPVKWGETTTLATLWEHVSRGQYKSAHPIEAQVSLTAGLVVGRLYYGLRWMTNELTVAMIPLLVAGIGYLRRRRSNRPWLLLAILAFMSSGLLYLSVGGPTLDRQDEFVQKVFLTPLGVFAAIPVAGGLAWMAAAIHSWRYRLYRRWIAMAAPLASCAMVAIPLVANWRDNNMRHYWYAYDHAQNIFASLLPKAIIFPSGDHNTFPLIYLIHVEGQRPDVTIADKYGYIDLDLYKDMPDSPGKPRTPEERERIETWLIQSSHRPAYYTVKKTAHIPQAKVVPVGLTYHLLPQGQSLDTESCWQRIRYRNLEGFEAPEDLAAMNILADYEYARGIHELVNGRKDEGRRCMDAALVHAWGMKEIHNNVGSAVAEYMGPSESIGYYEEAAKLDWRYAPARWNLARIFKEVGKFDWSAKVFEDLTNASPGDFRPFGELGFLLADQLKDPEMARYWFYESLRINPRQEQIIAALSAMQLGPTTRPSTQPAELITDALSAHDHEEPDDGDDD